MRRVVIVGSLLWGAVACQRQPLLPPGVPLPATPPGELASADKKDVATPQSPMRSYTAVALTDPEREQSRTLYKERCALCHGKAGHGDGIAAVNLRPSPRSLSDAEWQKSIADADIANIIIYGGAALGKSRMMPPSPDLKDEPALVTGLVEIVRHFATP